MINCIKIPFEYVEMCFTGESISSRLQYLNKDKKVAIVSSGINTDTSYTFFPVNEEQIFTGIEAEIFDPIKTFIEMDSEGREKLLFLKSSTNIDDAMTVQELIDYFEKHPTVDKLETNDQYQEYLGFGLIPEDIKPVDDRAELSIRYPLCLIDACCEVVDDDELVKIYTNTTIQYI